jgi:hypothetical protein
MFSDRDYQKNPIFEFTSETPLVTVQNWAERGYSVVNGQYFSARIELSYCLMLCAIWLTWNMLCSMQLSTQGLTKHILY